jgi:hypothetical protein
MLTAVTTHNNLYESTLSVAQSTGLSGKYIVMFYRSREKPGMSSIPLPDPETASESSIEKAIAARKVAARFPRRP